MGTEQPNLFTAPNAYGETEPAAPVSLVRAHRDDPRTSHLAAARVAKSAADLSTLLV